MLVVLVLYKTKLNDSKTFESLSQSLKVNNIKLELVVYDNSPEFNRDTLFEYPNWHITYIHDASNSGVSKAYNTAAEVAVNLKKKWLLLLDQDTDFPTNTIISYLFAIEMYQDGKLFVPVMKINSGAIISPCYFKYMRGISIKHIDTGRNDLDKYSVINSGMCIEIDAFRKNKGYNELIMLDFADHDFIRRFKKQLTNKFIVIDLIVTHQLSSTYKNSLQSDLNRFDYYLSGGKNMTASLPERCLFRFNAILRGFKLSVMHHNLVFLKNCLFNT